MSGDDWISIQERKPTKEDSDPTGCVVFWHVYNGVIVTGYHQVEHNRFLTHWQPPPGPPKNHEELRKKAELPFIHYMQEETK